MIQGLDPTAPATEVARELLGRHLVRVVDGVRRSGRIVEVEAYVGHEDRASHTWGGRRTKRNETMFMAGGHLYVYLIYGMHHCLNLVTGPEGHGEAVLLRALEPREGIEAMHIDRPKAKRTRDLCRGPGRLCAAMAVDRSLDGLAIGLSNDLWIEPGEPVEDRCCITGPRIGLGHTGPWADAPLRYSILESPFVSDPRPISR